MTSLWRRASLTEGIEGIRKGLHEMSSRITLAKGINLELDEAQARALHTQLTRLLAKDSSDPAGALPDDHPAWSRHSGQGDDAPEWSPKRDLSLAETFYTEVRGKAAVLFDYLIDNAGRQIEAEEIRAIFPDVFGSANSVAGALNGLRIPKERANRRYPFYWWAGTPSRYGMKQGVAALFAEARENIK